MSPVQVLLFAFFSAVSFVFSAEVYDNSKEMKICTTTNPEKESFVEPSFDEVEIVPPPPGSELLRTRKGRGRSESFQGRGRSESFHKYAEQMEKLDTRAVFQDPKRYEFFDHREERLDSGATDVEEWEEFIMDINSMYPSRTRSNSTETDKNTESTSSDSSNNLRKIFSSLSKSRSFKTSSTKTRPRLSSFSEVEEDEFYE